MGAQSLCDLLRGFQRLAGTETSFRGSDVAGSALVRHGNISTSGRVVPNAVPPLKPIRNRLGQRNLLADGRLFPLVVLVALDLQRIEVAQVEDAGGDRLAPERGEFRESLKGRLVKCTRARSRRRRTLSFRRP